MLSNENILELLELETILPVTQKPETISFVTRLKKNLNPESFEHDVLLIYEQTEAPSDRYQAAIRLAENYFPRPVYYKKFMAYKNWISRRIYQDMYQRRDILRKLREDKYKNKKIVSLDDENHGDYLTYKDEIKIRVILNLFEAVQVTDKKEKKKSGKDISVIENLIPSKWFNPIRLHLENLFLEDVLGITWHRQIDRKVKNKKEDKVENQGKLEEKLEDYKRGYSDDKQLSGDNMVKNYYNEANNEENKLNTEAQNRSNEIIGTSKPDLSTHDKQDYFDLGTNTKLYALFKLANLDHDEIEILLAAQTHGGMAEYADKNNIPRDTVRQIKRRTLKQLQTITKNLSSKEREVYEPND